MKVVATSEATLSSTNDIFTSDTPPPNPSEGQSWLDTSVEPPILRMWDGSKWVVQKMDVGALDPDLIDDLNNITGDKFPDIIPATPVNVVATGGFKTIQLSWDYDEAIYISYYEVFASQTENFVPNENDVIYKGRVSACNHDVNTNQTWYYRVRAVNTRGHASEYSSQVSASTVQIITDDILFGAITAEKIKDLSLTADKLANGSIDLTKIGQDVTNEIDVARQNALTAVNQAELANQNVQGAMDMAQTANDNAESVVGRITQAETNISANTLAITSKASQEIVDTLTGRVTNAESTLTQQATQITSKISVTDADKRYATSSQITQLSDAINLRVSKNDVVNQINVSNEGILIDGSKIRITGQTYIDTAVIKTGMIADASITEAKIANLAVGTASIQNGAITNAKMGTAVIGTAQIQNGAITNALIANATIDAAKIASVNATTIKSGTINAIDITGSNITGSTLLSGDINGAYTKIQSAYLISRGYFTKTWVENTRGGWHEVTIDKGHIKMKDTTNGGAVYYTARGMSTQMDGDNDGQASGTIEFMSTKYNSVNGLTIASSGNVAIESTSGSRIYLNPKGAAVHVANETTSYYDLHASTLFAYNTMYIGSWEVATKEYVRDTLITGTTVGNWQIGTTNIKPLDTAKTTNIGFDAVRSGEVEAKTTLRLSGTTTYSGSANVKINNGVIRETTSARKFKLCDQIATEVIEKAKLSLKINPAKWYDKHEVEAIANAMTTGDADQLEGFERIQLYYGFIADEFDEIGLTEVVEYDADGEVRGLGYDRIPMYHHVILQDHEKEISSLKEQIVFLQSRVELLEKGIFINENKN